MDKEELWQLILENTKKVNLPAWQILSEHGQLYDINYDDKEVTIAFENKAFLTLFKKSKARIVANIISDIYLKFFNIKFVLVNEAGEIQKENYYPVYTNSLFLNSYAIKKLVEKNERQRLKFERILQQKFIEDLRAERSKFEKDLTYAENLYKELQKSQGLLLYNSSISSPDWKEKYITPLKKVMEVCQERIKDLNGECMDNLIYEENLEDNKKNYTTFLLENRRLDLDYETLKNKEVCTRYLKIDDFDNVLLCILYCYESDELELGLCNCEKHSHNLYLEMQINRMELSTLLHELYINNYNKEKYINAGDLKEMVFDFR